jgi:hypothetical protein
MKKLLIVSLLFTALIQANEPEKTERYKGANCSFIPIALYGFAFNKALKTTHEILNTENAAKYWQIHNGLLKDQENAIVRQSFAYNFLKDEWRKLDLSLENHLKADSLTKSFIRNVSSSYYGMRQTRKLLCATAFGVWMTRLLHCHSENK